RDVRLPTEAVLRNRCRRSRTSGGEILGMLHLRSRPPRPPCDSAPGTPLRSPVFPVPPVVKPLLLLLILTLPLAPASAQVRNWRVTDFKDTVSIAADGTALVIEKITLAFVGEWHGIHRTIP